MVEASPEEVAVSDPSTPVEAGADTPEETGSGEPRAEPTAPDGGPPPWLAWISSRIDTDRKAVWAVVGLGVLLFFPFLGTLGLWDPWETH